MFEKSYAAIRLLGFEPHPNNLQNVRPLHRRRPLQVHFFLTGLGSFIFHSSSELSSAENSDSSFYQDDYGFSSSSFSDYLPSLGDVSQLLAMSSLTILAGCIVPSSYGMMSFVLAFSSSTLW